MLTPQLSLSDIEPLAVRIAALILLLEYLAWMTGLTVLDHWRKMARRFNGLKNKHPRAPRRSTDQSQG